MPPPPILDPAQLDLSNIVADITDIQRCNPHRYEFQLLDAVVLADFERNRFAGYHDVREDAFWVRGHIPGRPLMPGVLMIEATAQLASWVYHRAFENAGFLGFVGVDSVRFRGVVEPPARLVFVGHHTQLKPRRVKWSTQGFVDGTMVFEGNITGMAV
jgi:3-hydroxyacyl-[acyl-carrier-protein] dehydratase